MKRIVFVMSVLVLGCIGQGPPPESEPEESEGFQTYKDLTDDQILELIEHMSPVVLYIYSPTCASCLTVEPHVKELQQEYNLDIIWVNKMENQAIFDMYHFFYYPALYIYDDSEIYMKFKEKDSLTALYSQVLDKTIVGMHRIEYRTQDNQLVIPTDDLLPDTLYYLNYETHRLFMFISTGNIFVFSGSENCETHWLYLKKGLVYDGENSAQWEQAALNRTGGACGDLIQVPYAVTGSGIVITVEDIRWPHESSQLL